MHVHASMASLTMPHAQAKTLNDKQL